MHLWLELRLARRADSPRRLLSCLYNRGIDRELAEKGIKTALDSETEFELLKRYMKKMQKRKRFKKMLLKENTDPVRSLKYYLGSEGFSPELVKAFLENDSEQL